MSSPKKKRRKKKVKKASRFIAVFQGFNIDGDIARSPGPCNECPYIQKCSEEVIACLAYRRYVEGQTWKPRQTMKSLAPL